MAAKKRPVMEYYGDMPKSFDDSYTLHIVSDHLEEEESRDNESINIEVRQNRYDSYRCQAKQSKYA